MKYFTAILLMTIVVYCNATVTKTSPNYRTPNYSQLIPGFRLCQFQGDRYNIGETFNPKTIINGTEVDDTCVTCFCNPTTIVQCETVECPVVSCDNPVRSSGQCCDECLDDEDEPEIELETEAPRPHDCTLGGIIYEHGSSFHPPSSLHSHTEHIYCTVYTCNDGILSFTNVSASCPKMLGCSESEAFHVPGSCCKVCPEVSLQSGECKDELGKPRQHNETWNFYSTVFQMRLTCLNCSCNKDLSDSFSCSKNPCPPVPACPEDYKPDLVVICCPECSMDGSPTHPTPLNETVEIESCSFPYKVYLCNSSSMAIEDVKNKSVINYVWLAGGAKQAYLYSVEEFRNLECSHEHNYLGGTIERRVKGLQNRELKRNKIESCTAKCGELVTRMLRAKKTC